MAKWSALSSPISSFRNIFDIGLANRVEMLCTRLIIGGISSKSIGPAKSHSSTGSNVPGSSPLGKPRHPVDSATPLRG